MKTLIIGGAGYIGSYLRAHLSMYCPNIKTLDLEWFGSSGLFTDNIQIDFSAPTESFYKNFDVIILLVLKCLEI